MKNDEEWCEIMRNILFKNLGKPIFEIGREMSRLLLEYLEEVDENSHVTILIKLLGSIIAFEITPIFKDYIIDEIREFSDDISQLLLNITDFSHEASEFSRKIK